MERNLPHNEVHKDFELKYLRNSSKKIPRILTAALRGHPQIENSILNVDPTSKSCPI